MTKKRQRAARPQFRDAPGRRTVVLLSELPVEGRARPLPIGTVVEGAAGRFATLSEHHVRDATTVDVGMAGPLLVQVDMEPPTTNEPAETPPVTPAT